jgi:hypothetical protein
MIIPKTELNFLEEFYARLAVTKQLDTFVIEERDEKIRDRSSIPLCANCGKILTVGDPIQLIDNPPIPEGRIKSHSILGPYCMDEKTELWTPDPTLPTPAFTVLHCKLLPQLTPEQNILYTQQNEAKWILFFRAQLEKRSACDYCTYLLPKNKPRWLISAGRMGDIKGFELIGAFCSDAHAQKFYLDVFEKGIYGGPDDLYGMRRPVRWDPPEAETDFKVNGGGPTVGGVDRKSVQGDTWTIDAIARLSCQPRAFRISGHDILAALAEIADRNPEDEILGRAVSLVFGTGKFLTAEEKRDLTWLIGSRPISQEMRWRLGEDAPTRRKHAR